MLKMSIELAKYTASGQTLVRHALSGSTMGTRYSVVFYAPAGTNVPALNAALFAAVDRVDRQMSTWKADSDLNTLNGAPIGVWVDVPRELMTVLKASFEVERATQGAFNVGVGEIVSAWGFGPVRGNTAIVHCFANQNHVCRSASTTVELDEREGRARKSALIMLDLSGIAKGYGVDEMARVMNAFHIPTWLVGLDGEMRAKGLKPDGTMWSVAHERPDRHVREPMGILELQDMAVATSGNYRHCIEVGGQLRSHTVDPRTRAPLDNNVASVTVLASTCMSADAWATALMVMGVEAGLAAARSGGFDAIYVLQDGSVASSL